MKQSLTLILANNGLSAKTRIGLVRNTDSFFKDDTVETRKINLTPSLLRNDSSSSTLTPVSSDQKEVCVVLSSAIYHIDAP